MYDLDTRKNALALVAQGHSLSSASRRTGISRSAIREWQARVEPLPRMSGQAAPCLRCLPVPEVPADTAAYAYLLGLYLGDGCISPHRRGGHYLRIACADAWPGLIDLCRNAITAVRPEDSVYVLRREGCVMVTSYGRHWPCLFPQRGPGKKHERAIVLEAWQQAAVGDRPWEFVRGLIHSDGCRITNWTTRLIGGEQKRYEYPQYFFTNTSADILRLFTDTLDALDVGWKPSHQSRAAQNISVAKRASVALMDAHVGPKH
ncbi:helix-turn-helix domain-containing protein [Streptomyces enissocaesilis]|uniref:Transcriptional regulator n=1 Tax=Streptomyces enissocaesilis TaxID=332589 RepID=A0ABP6K473_9ACTN